jgi:uncharacterized protein YdhG (YjbR/CyaY superfamily)
MNSSAAKPNDIDEYIAGFPAVIQVILEQVRNTIAEAAPDAKETIGYGMPTFTLNGTLVHFAAFKNHIGFYSLPNATAEFQKELGQFKSGKGSIQFPLEKPMPLELIRRIVVFRVQENLAKAKTLDLL